MFPCGILFEEISRYDLPYTPSRAFPLLGVFCVLGHDPTGGRLRKIRPGTAGLGMSSVRVCGGGYI